MHGQLTEWTRDVAGVLTQSPGQPQLQALTTWLRRLGFADHVVLFIYEGRYLPLSLFDTFPAHLRHLFISEYQTGPGRGAGLLHPAGRAEQRGAVADAAARPVRFQQQGAAVAEQCGAGGG